MYICELYLIMKRIRLDIGAVTATPENGGSFMFFLYKDGLENCLRVKITPGDMHAVLANFKPDSTPNESVPTQEVLKNALQEFRIELLEVLIVRNEQKDCFESELLLFDSNKEVKITAGFVDGIILAKGFQCPIYIEQELMDKYSSSIDNSTQQFIDKQEHLNKLKEELNKAIASEDYERAAKINKAIDNISKNI